MQKSKKKKAVFKPVSKKRPGIVLRYIKCLIPGLAAALTGTALIALIYYKEVSYSRILYYAVYAAICAGGLITGFASYSTFKGRGAVTGALSGLPFAAVLISAILLTVKNSIGLFVLLIIPAGVISAAVGGIISANRAPKL